MIAVLDYGIGNLRSAEKALVHLGAEVRVVTDAKDASGASGIVLPGVGAFGASMRALRACGLDVVARKAIENEVPFFGICVGYQMLFGASEESEDERGLDILEGSVVRLRGDVRLPQMQWNTIQRTGMPSEMLGGVTSDEWMYFVHSFVPQPALDAQRYVVATTEYGERIAAAIERGNLWGVQFHPEKSGRSGLALLGRFLAHCEREGREL